VRSGTGGEARTPPPFDLPCEYLENFGLGAAAFVAGVAHNSVVVHVAQDPPAFAS
jgi:hypothetical protein